jgi:hypothetical protein
MNRINVYRYPAGDDYDAQQDGPILDGWFDLDKATLIDPDTYWNGSNQVNVHTRREHYHQYLYRTSGGRWVLNSTSNWQGVQPTYVFLTDDEARQWLTVNGSDDEIAKYFAPLAEESGPAPTGRPAVGPAINVRLGDDLLATVDARADDEGVTRAEMIRRLVAAGIAGQPATAHRTNA